MNHTPEPWMLFEVGDRFKHQCPASSEKTSILTIATEDDVQFGAVYNDEDSKRIVACVNACAGMRNDELEGGLLLGVMNKNIERLEAEREKLLSAIYELKILLLIQSSGCGLRMFHVLILLELRTYCSPSSR